MKQYLTSEQTAKLIELGLPKPENTQWNEQTIVRGIGGPLIELGIAEYRCSYSIGELLSFLPRCIEGSYDTELVDALYRYIVELKEEGVI